MSNKTKPGTLLSCFFPIWVTLRDEAKPRALFLFHVLSFAFPLPSGPCLLTSHIHTLPPQGPYIKQSAPQHTHTKSFLSGTTNVPTGIAGFPRTPTPTPCRTY